MDGNPLREDEIFAKSHAQVLEDLSFSTTSLAASSSHSPRLADNSHTDALEIARRARYKQFRAVESLAFLHLAIVSLVLFVIFVANVHDFPRGWWIASVFLIVASLLPLMTTIGPPPGGNCLEAPGWPGCFWRAGKQLK